MVPEEYLLGDKALYLNAVKNSLPVYSRTGIIPEQGMKNALAMLVEFDPELEGGDDRPLETFDDRFVKKAAAGK